MHRRLCLLSAKPVLYACNVSETDLADYSSNPYVAKVEAFAKEHHSAEICVISAAVEAELIDFESGFIKAEVVTYEDLIETGSVAKAREAGKYRLEGKDYVFRDGDVALFRFNN